MALDLGLRGKTAVVTGASQGIGRELARALYAEEVSLVLVSHTRESLEEAARAIAEAAPRGSKAALHTVVADLALRAEVERAAREALSRLDHVDILINNASRARTGNFFQMSDAEIEEAWAVKGLGYMRMVRTLAPHMMERREGRIVNIVGSTARTPTSDFIPGSMINAALMNFTQGISLELARHNVRINSISPGWTLTERQARSFEMRAAARGLSAQDILRAEARSLPLGRLVTTNEIAALALLLVSDLLPAMTGEDIVIDAGAGAAI
jgi:3-oxoacyl-[acyl-carrier protein] reductase/bacilysin biosynthesis oxidoreductase BacG